ncbi:MAG: cytochrome c3 family protein [Anaerolineae bacterium]
MNSERRLILIFATIGLALVVAGLLPLSVSAQESTPEPVVEVTPEATVDLTPIYDLGAAPVVPTGDNSYCLLCHGQPWRTATLADGTQLNMYVPAHTIANSVHGEDNPVGQLGCVDCHGDNFPHSEPPATARDYALQAISACVACHASEAQDLQVGLHEQAIRQGDKEAAVCTDCHGSHNIQRVVEQADLIAGVCGDCHENSYAEWRASGHVDLGPLGCATCHSQHTQMIRGGQSSNELCLSCHGETMPEIWVHENHLVEQSDVGCVDCHMYPLYPAGVRTQSVLSVEDRSTGHDMNVSTVPCTTCHESMSDDQTVAIIEPVPDTAEQEAAHTTEDTTSTTTVPLVQGLLFGLGIGATAAAIFVARGNKRS